MNYNLSFPYIKVYSDCKNRVRYVWYSSTTKRGMRQEETVGNVLIDFLLLDLGDYKKRVNELLGDDESVRDSMEEFVFISYNAAIYEIAKSLLPLHEIAYFYLFGKLNAVFTSNLSQIEQIKFAVQVLREIPILQQTFIDGLAQPLRLPKTARLILKP